MRSSNENIMYNFTNGMRMKSDEEIKNEKKKNYKYENKNKLCN